MVFRQEQTLTICISSRIYYLWTACITTIWGYSCTNSPIACFLKCLIVSSAELKIRAHIIPVNLQQNIYMWISEVRHEDKGPAFIAVLSSEIVFPTILTQSVLLVCLKNNPKHYSWTQKVIFLHEVCSTILQDKMLYLIINFDCET